MAIALGHLPDTATMCRWIEQIVSWGVRRPGTEADERTAAWIADEFRHLGLSDVRSEPVAVTTWEPGRARLEVSGPGFDGESFEGFAIPYCRPGALAEGQLAAFDSPSLDGSIAWMRYDLIELAGSAMPALAMEVVDPDGAFPELSQTMPFGIHTINILGPAAERGALGLVGLLGRGFWDTDEYYVPYDAIARPIPGIWLRPSEARRFAELVEGGEARARLVAEGAVGEASCFNVVGVLAGASDDWVIIGTHHDAPWASAVEDASGVAMLLAQATAWAQVPESERPHNLLFLATAAHMGGGAGTREFIEAHRDMLGSVVAEVHLEHVARASRVEGGRLVALDEPEVRWWFTTPHDDLKALVLESLGSEEIGRSLLMHPEVFGTHPTTDGGFFHLEGVPLVNLLAAPRYLFDPADTVEMVHTDGLLPLSRAVVRIVSRLAGRTPASFRPA